MGKVVDVAGIVRSGLLLLLLAFGVFGVEERKITHPSEVAALRAVRRSLIDPMKYLRSWDSGDPCRSSWIGVTCNKSSDDGYLHIRELQLLNMNLSGSLATELGELSHLELLDFMWNNISGSIPKEIGNITSLKLLLLNGNQLSGSLPDELGHLSKLDRLQIDENNISGPLPKTFVNLVAVMHLHMNNNSISGQIPPEIAKLPKLLHFLLDNNKLSGYLPPEFVESKTLLIIQLDNNNFSGASIPESYGRMPKLVKLSLRNCSLKGTIPDLSSIPELTYLDLSWNNLEGPLPSKRLSNNITTIDVSNNKLSGSIPSNISNFPALQFLSIKNNLFNGSLSTSIWDNITFSANGSFVLDARNNFLSNISSVFSPPSNVTIMLQGNQICSNQDQLNVLNACGYTAYGKGTGSSSNFAGGCPPQACPKEGFFEYIPASPQRCYCAAPLRVGYRLKSPGFSDFRPYLLSFENELAHNLSLLHYQIYIDTFIWEKGPRLRMHLKLFPNLSQTFNVSEVRRLRGILAGWKIHNTDVFGPYELLNFTLQGPYSNIILDSPAHWSKATLLGIIIGTISGAIILTVVVSILVLRRNSRYQHLSFKSSFSDSGTRPENLKGFSLEELAHSTNYFSDSSQVGSGGYGNVYKGTLADGTVVAIKRASEGSLQGSKEFYTEIELLSRLHHKNLVSLVGYCIEKSEQMLIYEFMPNGTLRDHLSIKSEKCLDFPMRLRIALGSARGILYLHNEADPPIFHRDIKATNILLDSNFTAKVADFGLSRLAPEPDAEGLVHGHVSTVVRGTPGYLDPEYFLTHKLTDKSDVYSLGVVFLELLSGKRPISNGKNIVREVRTAYNRSRIFSVVDDRLCSYPPTSVERFASLALRCCDGDLDSRPAMPEVVRELESICCMTMEAEFTHSESEVTDTSLLHSEQLCKSSSTSESYSRSGNNSTIFPR